MEGLRLDIWSNHQKVTDASLCGNSDVRSLHPYLKTLTHGITPGPGSSIVIKSGNEPTDLDVRGERKCPRQLKLRLFACLSSRMSKLWSQILGHPLSADFIASLT